MCIVADCRKIKAQVARKYMMSVKELEGPGRKEEIVCARNEAMFRCRYETKAGLSAIGRFFNRSHAAVIHALKQNGNGKDMHRDLGSH